MKKDYRSGVTLFQLLVILAILSLLFAMLFPLIAKMRAQALQERKLNNLRQIGIAVHNHESAFRFLPSGVDPNHFSAAAHLLPFVEQDNVFRLIDFKKAITDKGNQDVAARKIPVYLSPQDPLETVKKDLGATNYLFNAGSEPSLEKNNGVFFHNSRTRITDITDGTSNTLMVGETLKGDGGTKALDVKRQHVLLKADALKNIKDDAGEKDWKDNKNIIGDRCASWMDGRFLQGTFTATRLLNDPAPDVNCEGKGGLSALRSLDDNIAVVFCDGAARFINSKKVKLQTWKDLATRAGGEVVNIDF